MSAVLEPDGSIMSLSHAQLTHTSPWPPSAPPPATPQGPSSPSQLLTLQAQTSLDTLEAPEHPRSNPALALTHAEPLSSTLPQIPPTLQSHTQTPPPLGDPVQSPSALWPSGPAFSAAPNTPSVSVSASQVGHNFLKGRGHQSSLCVP